MFKDKYFTQEQYPAISRKEMSVNSNRKWNSMKIMATSTHQEEKP